VLGRLADMLEQQVQLRQKITAALIYPAILVAMSLVSIGVIVTVLIPSIDPIFADTGVPLPGILRVLTDIQNHWFTLTFLSAILLMGSVASGRLIRTRPQLAISVDRVKCRLPILGPLLRARDAAACARSLGTLLSSGVPLMTALENSKALLKNSYLAACYKRAISRIPEGTSFHLALADSALFSAAALRIVAVGEETGKLGTSLLRTATLIETDLQQRIERLVTVLTPMLTLCVGGSIGFLVMEVMSAVLSINDLAFK
jgi:general secretion pathway protein F